MAARSRNAGQAKEKAGPVGDEWTDFGEEAAGTANPRDRVIRGVVRRLYEGQLEPGERLVEAQLTHDYEVSRGPVREALNRLAAMGVVDLMPQRGAKIRVLSLEEAIDSLVVVQGLVGMAARLAAERIDGQGEARLTSAIDEVARFDQASPSADYALARDSFYSALVGIAGNSTLSRAMMPIDIHLIRIQFREALQMIDRRRHRDYVDIAEAVCAGNAKRAEKLAEAHLGRSIAALRTFGEDSGTA